MKVNINISKKVFNDVYLPYLDNEDRYLIFYGGGSSGKSFFIAQRWVYMLIQPRRCNLLVVRNTGDTNRTSTFPLFKQVISAWKLSEYFKINVRLNDIELPFSLTVKRNTEEEKIFRDATKMINAYYNEYKSRFKGMDSTSYYGMVALLTARLYIETSNAKKNIEATLGELEKELAAYLDQNK